MLDLKIGEKLKRLRLANDLTQEELANRTGVTKGFISQLERDQTSPSLATLKDILDVLGESLAAFFEEHPEEHTVYRQKDRILMAESTKEFKVELLVQASQKRDMEPVLVTLAPGAKTWEDRSHQGQEFGFILDGSVRLRLGRDRYELRKGDCFYFTSDKKHLLENTGQTHAQILWVVTPPTF